MVFESSHFTFVFSKKRFFFQKLNGFQKNPSYFLFLKEKTFKNERYIGGGNTWPLGGKKNKRKTKKRTTNFDEKVICNRLSLVGL